MRPTKCKFSACFELCRIVIDRLSQLRVWRLQCRFWEPIRPVRYYQHPNSTSISLDQRSLSSPESSQWSLLQCGRWQPDNQYRWRESEYQSVQSCHQHQIFYFQHQLGSLPARSSHLRYDISSIRQPIHSKCSALCAIRSGKTILLAIPTVSPRLIYPIKAHV